MHRLRFSLCVSRGFTALGLRSRPASTRSISTILKSERHRPVLSIRDLEIDLPRTHRSFHSASAVIENDTIYALSTAPGRAAIAVIRVSGPACLSIYKELCPGRTLPKPRVATLRKLRSPEDPDRILDTGALLLYFPAPNTVTGEDVLELHVHGGPAIVRSVLEAVSQAPMGGIALVRPAEAGEFTKRAFYNNRIDLAEVEALGEALAAETEQQRRLAISSAESGLTQRYEEWRSMLLYARGELEALIDFSEDQHFDESPHEFMTSVSRQVLDLKKNIELHILNAGRGELLRSGINVALLGPPNAGKSSLLNRIVGREAAIVSAEEGTTRDIVDVGIDMQGWLVRLGDMAGLRVGLRSQDEIEDSIESTGEKNHSVVGEIEREGIRRARVRALQSDLIIVLISLRLNSNGSVELCLNDELISAVRECRDAGKNMIFALNKIDLLHAQSKDSMVSISRLLSQLIETFPETSPNDVFCLSCKDADSSKPDEPDSGGLQTFVNGLTKKFSAMTSAAIGMADDGSLATLSVAEAQSYWSASLSVTHRQSQFLKECQEHLSHFLEIGSSNLSPAELGQNIAMKIATNPGSSTGRSSTGFFDTGNPDDRGAPQAQHTYHIDNHEDIVGEIEVSHLDSSARGSSPAGHTSVTQALTESTFDPEIDIVTAAEHLRNAADCLARLTGRGDGVSSGADVEDVLGVVFEK